MIVKQTTAYTAPAISQRIVEFNNNGDLPPYIVVENLDTAASASIQYQESDNGVDWAPIVGTTATVNPGKSDGQLVRTPKSRIALFAGGNVKVMLSLIRQVNGSPTNIGAA